MKLIKKLICKWFGHTWGEWSSPENPKNRICERCKLLHMLIVYSDDPQDNALYVRPSFSRAGVPVRIEGVPLRIEGRLI